MTTTTTERLEPKLGRVLRVSSNVSTAMLAVGLATSLVWPSIDPRWNVMRAGLIILLGGPVARVALAAVTYWRAREWATAAMALAVFAILIASIVLAAQTGP